MLNLTKLAHILQAKPTGSSHSDLQTGGVSIDSRSVSTGDCFVAIKGQNFDGHVFVAEAVKKGAVCAVVCKGSGLVGKIPAAILEVDDTVVALGDMARWYRTQLKGKVIAITGSVGKTTVRHITAGVLGSMYRTHQARGSFNNQIGLALTLLDAPIDAEFIITELGTNNPGEIQCLTDIALPDAAAVISIAPAHLEGLGSVEQIIREKVSIVKGLKDNGKFLINGDCRELVDHCSSHNIKFLSFGFSESCDITGSDPRVNGTTSSLKINDRLIEVPLAGEANLCNTLAGWAICSSFGISIEQFQQGLRNIEPLENRLGVKDIGPITIINDCYNANPASMQNAVEYLSYLGKENDRRTVFICGDMAELGLQSTQYHQQLGEMSTEKGVSVLAAVGSYAEVVTKAAKGISNTIQTLVFENKVSVSEKLHEFVQPDDIILVKASHSIGLEFVVDKLIELFG